MGSEGGQPFRGEGRDGVIAHSVEAGDGSDGLDPAGRASAGDEDDQVDGLGDQAPTKTTGNARGFGLFKDLCGEAARAR
jgi:hypothetical protein